MVTVRSPRELAMGAVVVLLATACAAAPTTQAPAESAPAAGATCAQAQTFCIGLALEAGVIDDGAFNAAAWEGVQEAATATGGIAEYLEPTQETPYAAILEEFGSRNFDVVVTTGVGEPEATVAAANGHPDTHYIGISQDMSDGPANSTGLLFRDDEAGYMAGYLAGLMTQTGTVSAVLGSAQVTPLRRFGEGYRQGALAARPDATVVMTYNDDSDDSFNDPQWGAATANQQLAEGADVVFGAGGTTGIAALEAVAKAPGAGTSLFCIGIDVDQFETVPQARPCLLSSAEKLITAGVRDLIIQIHAGSAPDRNVEGEIGLAPYHDLADQVPDRVKVQVDEIIVGLNDGSIDTGVDF